jgi:hypothetical protein
MNSKDLIAAATLALIAVSATAQEATPDTWTQVPAVKSVQQVRSELTQARKDGTIKFGSAGYMEKLPSAKSREQVRDEVIGARYSGELRAIGAEAYAFVPTRKEAGDRVAGTR